MMKMNTTLRSVLVATVASSLLLAACSSKNDVQQPKVSGPLHAPKNNPQLNNAGRTMMEDAKMRAPEANATMAVGSEYKGVPANQQPEVMAYSDSQATMKATAPTTMSPAQKEKSGMFDWVWANKQQQQQPQVNTAQRKQPVLNANPNASVDSMGMASYEASAPVMDVEMASTMTQDEWIAPQQDIIVAEELSVMDEPFTPAAMAEPNYEQNGDYPTLASVPPRPERVNVMDVKGARMADMEAARAESMAMNDSLDAQMQADMGGSMMAQDEWSAPQNTIDSEFAAIVGAESPAVDQSYSKVISSEVQTNEVVVVQEPAPAVVVSQGAAQPWEMPGEVDQNPAPIEMASTQQEPVQASWNAAPMGEVQSTDMQPMLAPQNEVVVQEGEWISLQQDPAAQMAVPVEEVSVSGAPVVASVSAVPVMPEQDTAGSIQLTPPSAFGRTVRTLPESRYAGRRQAVYMQRYARQVQADESN